MRWWLVLTAVVLVLVSGYVGRYVLPGHEPLNIYSSLPEREQRQPASVSLRGVIDAPAVAKNQRVADMEDAIRLALRQSGGKAGPSDVSYESLDSSDESGASPASLVESNAKHVAGDDHAAAYIGDFTSGATQQSIPILSHARIAQISPASSRVGLTTRDPRGDVNEPARYYPPQAGYPGGYRNFVRIIPRDTTQAKALLALMTQRDQCKTAAMINDNSAYGEALANNILDSNQRRVRFIFSQSVGPYGRYQHLVERARKRSPQPDCFVYAGSRNPNTVEILAAFATALPSARLYGTDGLVTPSFYDDAQGGLAAAQASRVQVMVPPRDSRRYETFASAFQTAYGRAPDPYAVYAFEAMRIALDAIAATTTGGREAVRDALFAATEQPDSILGPYSLTPNGDTTVATYGVSRIVDGRLTTPRTAPRLARR